MKAYKYLLKKFNKCKKKSTIILASIILNYIRKSSFVVKNKVDQSKSLISHKKKNSPKKKAH